MDLVAQCHANSTVVCLDFPQGREFGTDLRTYAVGPLFRGMKLIPPGLHLVIFGSELDRSGAFVRLGPGEVCVFKWDAATELPTFQVPDEERERVSAAVHRMELDAGLGPYELHTAAEWHELACHVDESVLQRAGVPCGTVVVPGSADDEAAQKPAVAGALRPYFDGLPRVASYTQVDPCQQRAGGEQGTGGRRGAELTQFLLDRSEWLGQLLRDEYGGGGGGDAAEEAAGRALVGELQLAFLLFLQLSSLAALEQWKALVHLLCCCDAAMLRRPALFASFLRALEAQLRLAPSDLFVDALSAENFLRASLASLAGATEGAPLAPPLASQLERFWQFVGERFGGDILAELRDADADPDDAPCVVEAPDACMDAA